jgi:hypothetical protein
MMMSYEGPIKFPRGIIIPKEAKLYRTIAHQKRAIQMQVPFLVETKEGWLYAPAGSYLVEGIEGELYPCDKTIFEKSYEPV